MTQPTLVQLREAAQQEIIDIDALANSQPFNRYFVGKLNALYRKEVSASLTEKLIEDREKARHRANLLHELSEMPAKDRQSCENFLRAPDGLGDRPTQAG